MPRRTRQRTRHEEGDFSISDQNYESSSDAVSDFTTPTEGRRWEKNEESKNISSNVVFQEEKQYERVTIMHNLKKEEETLNQYKRKDVVSNWLKYEEDIPDKNEYITDGFDYLVGEDFSQVMANNESLNIDGYMNLKAEQTWGDASSAYVFGNSGLGALRLQDLTCALATLPLHVLLNISPQSLSEQLLAETKATATANAKVYKPDFEYTSQEEINEGILQNLKLDEVSILNQNVTIDSNSKPICDIIRDQPFTSGNGQTPLQDETLALKNNSLQTTVSTPVSLGTSCAHVSPPATISEPPSPEIIVAAPVLESAKVSASVSSPATVSVPVSSSATTSTSGSSQATLSEHVSSPATISVSDSTPIAVSTNVSLSATVVAQISSSATVSVTAPTKSVSINVPSPAVANALRDKNSSSTCPKFNFGLDSKAVSKVPNISPKLSGSLEKKQNKEVTAKEDELEQLEDWLDNLLT